jgi:glutathione S-transferase
MKLYMHPVSMTSRPVRLFIAENNVPVSKVIVIRRTSRAAPR